MRKPVKLLVMGLPRVGKTTFLAAFWHLLTSGEVRDSLVLAEWQPSRDHLNTIATLWRQWKEIPRTTLPKERVVTMNVSLPQDDQIFELAVPDASGEAFKRIFETRHCSKEFEALASEACDALLFVHPNQAVPPERIDLTVDKMSETLEKVLATSALDGQEAAEPEVNISNAAETELPKDSDRRIKTLEWNAKYSAYQAKLVDLLQVAARFRGQKKARLAVVISAWDLCEAEKLEPEHWAATRLPLLYQYLQANNDRCEFAIYGVSAQGTELKAPGDLVNAIRASDRIKVVRDKEVSKDLTLPIRYLLDNGAGGRTL